MMRLGLALVVALTLGACGGAEGQRVSNINEFDPYAYHDIWQGDPSLPSWETDTVTSEERSFS